jgi:hypothetical protein
MVLWRIEANFVGKQTLTNLAANIYMHKNSHTKGQSDFLCCKIPECSIFQTEVIKITPFARKLSKYREIMQYAVYISSSVSRLQLWNSALWPTLFVGKGAGARRHATATAMVPSTSEAGTNLLIVSTIQYLYVITPCFSNTAVLQCL